MAGRVSAAPPRRKRDRALILTLKTRLPANRDFRIWPAFETSAIENVVWRHFRGVLDRPSASLASGPVIWQGFFAEMDLRAGVFWG